MRSGNRRETVGAALLVAARRAAHSIQRSGHLLHDQAGSQSSSGVRPARIKSQSAYPGRPAGAHKKGAPLRFRGRATIAGQRMSQEYASAKCLSYLWTSPQGAAGDTRDDTAHHTLAATRWETETSQIKMRKRVYFNAFYEPRHERLMHCTPLIACSDGVRHPADFRCVLVCRHRAAGACAKREQAMAE